MSHFAVINGLRGCVWVNRTDATLSQAAPVQNTWYEVLTYTGKYTHIYHVVVSVAVANETLECEIIVDGVTYAGSLACTAGTFYQVYYGVGDTTAGTLSISGSYPQPSHIEGSNIRVRVRKTTAAGAGTLTAKTIYSTAG